MKYTLEERLDIGQRIYQGELTIASAAYSYDVNLYTARDYFRMYKARVEQSFHRQELCAHSVDADTDAADKYVRKAKAPDAADGYTQGTAERYAGVVAGQYVDEITATNVRKLMTNLQLSLDQALIALDIEGESRTQVIKQLQRGA